MSFVIKKVITGTKSVKKVQKRDVTFKKIKEHINSNCTAQLRTVFDFKSPSKRGAIIEEFLDQAKNHFGEKLDVDIYRKLLENYLYGKLKEYSKYREFSEISDEVDIPIEPQLGSIENAISKFPKAIKTFIEASSIKRIKASCDTMYIELYNSVKIYSVYQGVKKYGKDIYIHKINITEGKGKNRKVVFDGVI
jgi:hypothetical protein